MNRLIPLWGLCWMLISSCTEQVGVQSEDELVEGRALTASDYLSARILPEKTEIAAGRRLPFRVTGILPYGRDSDLTDKGTFASSDPDILDFPKDQKPGTGVAFKPGSVLVSFNYGSLEISTELTVSDRVLDQFILSQSSLKVAIDKVGGVYEQRRIPFQATGVYSDGSSENLNAEVTWSLSDENSVTPISDSPGYFLTKAPGKTQVTASIGDKSQTLPIEVVQGKTELRSLLLTPSQLLLPLQTAKDIQITALYSDGTSTIVTDSAEFAVTPSHLASLQTSGGSGIKIASQNLGSGTLSVTYKELSVEFPLAAIDAEASTLRLVSNQFFSLAKGEAESFQLWLDTTDGTQENVTTRATWTVVSPTVLSPVAGTKGRYSALRVGSTSVNASLGALTASQLVTITPARMTSLAITTTGTGELGLYQTRDFIATATYSDATTRDVSNEAAWSFVAASGQGQFDISVKSRFQGLESGSFTISAAADTLLAHFPLTVGGVVPISLNLQAPSSSPWTSLSLTTGAKNLLAWVNYSDGSSVNMTNSVAWNFEIVGTGLNFAGYVSNDAGSQGLCVPVATGFYKAKASYLGLTAEKSIQVTP